MEKHPWLSIPCFTVLLSMFLKSPVEMLVGHVGAIYTRGWLFQASSLKVVARQLMMVPGELWPMFFVEDTRITGGSFLPHQNSFVVLNMFYPTIWDCWTCFIPIFGTFGWLAIFWMAYDHQQEKATRSSSNWLFLNAADGHAVLHKIGSICICSDISLLLTRWLEETELVGCCSCSSCWRQNQQVVCFEMFRPFLGRIWRRDSQLMEYDTQQSSGPTMIDNRLK